MEKQRAADAERNPERELFVMSLLLDRNKLSRSQTAEAEVNTRAIQYGLRAPGRERRYYAVAIVKNEDTEIMFRDLTGMIPVGEEIFGKKCTCCGICSGGKLIYLIGGSREVMNSQLSILASELVQRMERTTHTRCSIGISSMTESLLYADKAYDEASFVIGYLPERVGGVYFIEDIISMLEFDHNRFSSIVSKFEGLLKVGDRNDLEEYINEVFSEKKLRSLPKANTDMLCMQLTYCVYKAICDVSSGSEAARFLAQQFVSPFKPVNKDDILKLCMEAKGIMTNQRKQNAELLSEKTMHIIDSEYGDENLSLASVCERLHVSASYLSTVLRKNRGDTFVNLLTEKRMTAAKEYLMCTSMKIMEVAHRCGYPDQHYFSVCFKRYYGISPNKIRKTDADTTAKSIS